MKRLFLTLFFLWVTLAGVGCTTIYWQPKCNEIALYAASVAGKDYPVRIAWGKNHVEAQVFIEGEWKFLVLSNGWIVTRDKVRRFNPTHFESFEEYADRFQGWFQSQERQ